MSKRRNTVLLLSLLPLLVAAGPIPRGNSTATNTNNLEATKSSPSQDAEVFHMAPGPMVPDNTLPRPSQITKREEAIVLPSLGPSTANLPPGPGLMVPTPTHPKSGDPLQHKKRGEGSIDPSLEASAFETPIGTPIIPDRVLLSSDQVKRDEAIILPSSAPSNPITIFPPAAGPMLPNEPLPLPPITQNKRDEATVLPSSAPSTTEPKPKPKPNLVKVASQIDGGELLEFLRKVTHASSEEEREKIVKESKYGEDYETLRKALAVGF